MQDVLDPSLEAHLLERLNLLRELERQVAEQEAEIQRNIDVFDVLGYTPNEKQAEFHAATEDDVLYGGAAGGGKSVAIVMEAFRAAVRFPGIRILLVRRTYDELAESIFPVLRRYRYANVLGARWNKTDKELVWPNGSVFRCRYLDGADDASRRQGGEYQLLLVDEATLLPPGTVDILKFERLRSSDRVPVIGTRMTCNPGGPSHGDIKVRYIEATDYGKNVVVDDNRLSVRFIQAKATDNPHLDEAYHRRLNAIPDPDRRAAMRDGSWDRYAGQMFTEYDRDRHVVRPVQLPVDWRRYAGVDWGFTAPWAVVWGALDPDGRVWVYREVYEAGVYESDQARKILELEAGEKVHRYADDSMWDMRGEGDVIASRYAKAGVKLEKAGKGPGSRIIGWQRIHSFMAEGPACLMHRDQGWERCPMIHFFDTCPNLLRELSALPHATSGNIEDADSKAPDHAADALRYMLINLGTEPRWFWPDAVPEVVDLDPSQRGPYTPVARNMIGGFPVMAASGNPWDVFG